MDGLRKALRNIENKAVSEIESLQQEKKDAVFKVKDLERLKDVRGPECRSEWELKKIMKKIEKR